MVVTLVGMAAYFRQPRASSVARTSVNWRVRALDLLERRGPACGAVGAERVERDGGAEPLGLVRAAGLLAGQRAEEVAAAAPGAARGRAGRSTGRTPPSRPA